VKRLLAWLSSAPLWLDITLTLAYCLVVMAATCVVVNLVDGYPAFSRPYMYFYLGIPLAVFLTALSVWQRSVRGPRGNGSRNAKSA
jgi:hypothetical protein